MREVVATPRNLSLTKREADVALRFVPFTQAELVVRKVAETAYGLYAAPAYLERHPALDWAELAGGGGGHTLVTTEADQLDTPEMQFLRRLAPNAGVALASNSRPLLRSAVCHGMGLGCLARYFGDGEPGLVRLVPPEPPPTRTLWLGVHNDLRHMPRIRAFTDARQEGLRRAASTLNPPA